MNMDKQTLLKPLILITLLLTSCGESSDKWAPDVVVNRRDQRESRSWVKANNEQVQDTDYFIQAAIRKAAPYKHVNKNKTTSENTFEYSLDVSGYIFPRNCFMTFYDDGYVQVESGDIKFVYSFDAQKAKTLYQVAVTFVDDNSQPSEHELNDVIALEFGKEDNKKAKDGNEIFSLKEFNDVTFSIKHPNGYTRELYANDALVEPDLYTSPYIFASDINNDGYRELIFDRNKRENEKAGNYFVVYDVKNNKVLLDEANTKERSHYNYRFNYGLIEDKLTFYPYIGNYSESSITDYGYLKYSQEKGAYFEWKNIFAITSIELVKFYVNDTNKEEVVPTNNVYTFKLNTKYCMEYKANRTNFDREFGNDFLSVFWDNDHPSHFGEYIPNRNETDITTGKYVVNFTVINPFEGATWEFFYMDYGFNVNYKVEA